MLNTYLGVMARGHFFSWNSVPSVITAKLFFYQLHKCSET